MAARARVGQRRSPLAPLLPCLLLLLFSPSFVAPWKPAARTSRLPLRAQNPVATLRKVVTKSLNHTVSKGGIRFSVQSGSEEESNVTAQVRLHCLKRQPRFVGKAAPTLKEAEASLAKSLLEDPKFLISLIMDAEPKPKKKAREEGAKKTAEGEEVSEAKEEGEEVPKADVKKGEEVPKSDVKPKKKAKKTKEERTEVAELKQGDQVSGKVVRRGKGGVWVDVGADKEAYMSFGEMCDGYPRPGQVPKVSSTVRGRVLFANDEAPVGLLMTRRKGSLERPEFAGTMEERRDLPSSEWFTGKVVGMIQGSVLVDVEVPGDEKRVRGELKQEQFSPEFWKEAAPGSPVRVRKLDFSPKGYLTLTMRGVDDFLDPSKLAPGQLVNGTVRNVYTKEERILGLFLNIGTVLPAFMPIDQLNDGLPSSEDSMRRVGRTFSVRVLDVDEEGKVTVTRRSGDLYRPVVTTLTNTEEALSAYSSLAGKFFEGEVVRLSLTLNKSRSVWMRLAPEGLPEIFGRLPLGDAPRSLPKEVYPGQKLSVRIKNSNGLRVFFSMKEEGEEEGQEESQARTTAAEEEEQAQEEPATAAKADVPPQKEEESPTTTTATTTKKPDDVFGFLFR